MRGANFAPPPSFFVTLMSYKLIQIPNKMFIKLNAIVFEHFCLYPIVRLLISPHTH